MSVLVAVNVNIRKYYYKLHHLFRGGAAPQARSDYIYKKNSPKVGAIVLPPTLVTTSGTLLCVPKVETYTQLDSCVRLP